MDFAICPRTSTRRRISTGAFGGACRPKGWKCPFVLVLKFNCREILIHASAGEAIVDVHCLQVPVLLLGEAVVAPACILLP